jgi:Mg-chelatase subunit ChlD
MSNHSIEKIMGLVDHKESTEVIDSFTFDKEIYREVYDQSSNIQESVAEGDSILRTFPDFAQDLYMSLYKHRPKVIDKEEVKDTHQFNHQLMNEVMELPEFKQLRQKTRLDMIGSAMGMEAMSEQAVQIVKHYEEQMMEQNGGQSPFEGINQAMDGEAGQGEGEGEGQGQGEGAAAGDGQGQGTPGQGSGGMTEQQAKDMANGKQPTPNDPSKMQPNANTPRPTPPIDPKLFQDAVDGMQQAAQKALKDVSETRDFLQAWGMEDGNGANRITYENKKKALQRLRKSQKVKKLTELVGRMKKLAINEQKSKAPEGAESIKTVVTGNDITAILPSEKALLASSNPNLKRQFYRKFHQKELLQYDMDVYESMGKGPMIVCVDTSGSMSGDREHWSKAVALALLEVATKQKRNYACIHYDSRIQHVWEIAYGELKPDDVFDIAEFFSGGGTDFERPLRKSLEILENSKFKKADIVFITDGDCYVSDPFLEEFLAKKKEKEFQVHTVLIDMYGGGGRSGIARFSDKIFEVSDLANKGKQSEGALNIFRNVN